MKKVLFIAYHFPPIAGGGVFRSLKFVKYLPKFGWQPTVLTVDTKLSWAYNNKLLEEIPCDIKIIRAKQFEWFYLHIIFSKIGFPKIYDFIKDKFLIPDSKIGWYSNARRKAKKELKSQTYDAIFSTSPTIVSHLIAMKLTNEFKIPWICDFRDFWTLHKNYKFNYIERGQKEAKYEKSIIENCSKMTVVSEGMKNEFLQKYSDIDSNKINVITNGFDSDFLEISKKTNIFQITYTGSFYGEYDPEIFIDALQKIIFQNKEFANKVRVKFIGNISNDIKKRIQTKIPEHLNFLSFQNAGNLKQYIESSTVLLLYLPNDEHYKSYIPTKLFDYLSYSKPIFAIIPKGDCSEILLRAGLGYFPGEYSETAIEVKLLEMFDKWKVNALTVSPDKKYINQFNREKLTKKLVEIFES